MASISQATGFAQGFQGALSDVRQRRMEDEDRLAQQQARQESMRYAQKRENRDDLLFSQQQQDRANELGLAQVKQQQERQQMLKQAQSEGLHNMLDAIDAGADPSLIEQQMNSVGSWKIKPGSLQYDQSTKGPDRMVTFTGEGGQQFKGTMGQLRAVFGQQQTPGKLTALKDGERLVNDKGQVILDSQEKPAKPEFKGFSPNEDIYSMENGKLKLVKKGDPKTTDADGNTTGPGGRKVSPYNPESHAKEAVDISNAAFKKRWDEATNTFSFENPADSQRQAYAADLATGFIQSKGAEGAAYGAGEVGSLANRASLARLTPEEAADKVKKAGYAPGTPDFDKQTAKLIRDSAVKAAQIWNEGIDALEQKRQEREKSQQKNNSGGKPPLSSFQR